MHSGGSQARQDVGVAMFELSALRGACVPVAAPPNGVDQSLLAVLAGRVFRFAVPGVSSVRLPRDPQVAGNLWKSISSTPRPLPDQLNSAWPAVAWTVLTTPVSRVPLAPTTGCDQAFAVAAAVEVPGGRSVMVSVRIGVSKGQSRYAQPGIEHASVTVAADLDEMAELLESLYVDSLPQARAAALRTGSRAIWLGGDQAVDAVDRSWRRRVEAVGAVMGLRVEVIEEPARRIRTAGAAFANGDVPGHLLVWNSMCRGAGQLIGTFQKLSADGTVLHLSETAFSDVLVETRLDLLELGLAEVDGHSVSQDLPEAPPAGEERFYTKTGGRKTGDVLIHVADCGHGHWGSDVRRKAPRAAMGVERLEGARPIALFLCEKCSKHRWRARF